MSSDDKALKPPKCTTCDVFEQLYAELLDAVKPFRLTPDAEAFRLGPAARVHQLYEISDVLKMFADVYDLKDDDNLQRFSEFVFGIIIYKLDAESRNGAIMAALLNAREAYRG